MLKLPGHTDMPIRRSSSAPDFVWRDSTQPFMLPMRQAIKHCVGHKHKDRIR
jgi:hypothetical protein